MWTFFKPGLHLDNFQYGILSELSVVVLRGDNDTEFRNIVRDNFYKKQGITY